MEKTSQTSPFDKAFEMLSGMFTAQVLSAMTQLNVFEAFGQGAKSLDELAEVSKVNKNTLSRTLRYLVLLGVVVDENNNTYSLTDIGKCFLKETPGSLYGSMSFVSAPPWRNSWNNFSHCLKTGESAFDNVFKQSFFSFLDQNQEYGKPFNHYMTMMTTRIAPVIAEAYDFGTFKTICDVGGGQGILLKAVLQKNPDCNGILFDMENTLANHVLEETADRTQLVAGNFFEKIPEADCLLLKTVIHDWNDENSIRILTNCRKALHKGGRILLVEQVIEQPYTLMGLFYDLHMQVMLGGAERTEQEFEKLFEAAGLKLNKIIPTKSPMKIIEVSANN